MPQAPNKKMVSNDLPRSAREDRVLGLLNQIGDRLVHSEKERLALSARLRRYEEILAGLEHRDKSLRAWQQRVEKEYQIQADKMKRAEALTQKIEDAMAQHARMDRRLEKMMQDRVRLLRKLERIEETVQHTRDALESKALVLLTDREAAAQGSGPQLPASVNTEAPDLLRRAGLAGAWWKKQISIQIAGVSALVLIAVFSGWAISHMPRQMAAYEIPEQPAEAAPLTDAPSMETERIDDAAGAVAIPDTKVLAESLESNPDAVAAALNAVEPSNLPPPAQAETRPDVVVSDNKAPESVAMPEKNPGAPLDHTDSKKESADPENTVKETIAPEAAPVKETQAKAAGASIAQDLQGAESFIKAAQADARPLAERIKADPGLPSIVKEIEKKAFEGLPEAQHDLAAIYTAGHGGVVVDYQRAAAWFREAAIHGVANARYNLGVLHQQGLGAEKNVDTAMNWYRAAALLDHPEAQYNLGIAHIEGVGAGYDPVLAAEYFERAANGGIVEAAYNLGLVHENGLLGEAQPREALYWYKRAADQGNPEAQTAMTQLAKSLNIAVGDIDGLFKDRAPAKKEGSGTTSGAKADKKADKKAEKKSEKKTVAQDQGTAASSETALPATKSAGQDSPFPKVPVSAAQPAEGEGESQAIVAQIQEQLVRMGLYPGPADGVKGPQTEDAIRVYQASNDLYQTGRASEALLIHMLTSEMNSTITPGGLNEDDMMPPGGFGP